MDNQLMTIVRKHYPTARVVKHEDMSTGCDNWIHCFTFAESVDTFGSNKVIIRLPRKLSEDDCPAMHSPHLQGYVLNILHVNSIPAPKLLHLSSDYLIESYLEDKDLSKVVLSDQQLDDVFREVGVYVQKLHSIECCEGFGYIVDLDQKRHKLVAKYENWFQLFDNEFPVHLNGCLNQGLIDEKEFQKCSQLLSDLKPYLLSYSSPKLLHSDICGNNLRVISVDNSYQFNGFIDFADCMAGDPMFDLGEVLCSYFGDFKVIERLEKGYGLVTNEQKVLIRFYAIYYVLWLLNTSVLSADTHKWFKTLKKLLSEEFS